ncbi:DNA repair exonuclease [bacterium]|nr:DNA repair exonuclease [bacterium]
MAIRFLQIGDTHLGAALSALPPEIAETLRRSARDVFAEALQRAGRDKLDLVLLPGDLFEQDGQDPAAQLRFIYEQAAALAPTHVVITPGNHDPVFPGSPYLTEAVPANVTLFVSGELLVHHTPLGPVVGRAVQTGEGAASLNWIQPPVGDRSQPTLMVLHASVLGTGDGRLGRNTVVPTAVKTLQQSGYSYIALGHYHRHQAWSHTQSELAQAAYAGCPQGQGWDEPGPRGYLLGELEPDGARLNFVPAARHVWYRQAVELPPDYADDAEARLLAVVQEIYDKVGKDDLLELAVRGRWPAGRRSELVELVGRIGERAWFTRPVDWSQTEFFDPLVGAGDSEAVDNFLARCEQGLAKVPEGDADEQRAWLLARYLGLRLLSGQGLPEEVA